MNTNDNQTWSVTWLLKAFQKLPKVAKWIISIAISVIVGTILLTFAGCGNVTKIAVSSETPNNVEISVTQSNDDSTSFNVQVNPTINFPSNNGKKNETEVLY